MTTEIKIKPMEAIKQDMLDRISIDEYKRYIQSEKVHKIVKLSQIENYYGAAFVFTSLCVPATMHWLDIRGFLYFIIFIIGVFCAIYFYTKARIYHDKFRHEITSALTDAKMEYWKLKLKNDDTFK
ncbi:hypothetical protein CO051_03400 [Candidatus Roizmanbacteria bacterium CG_4_9_14_0_2_um_filter_39_13]|uniref:Uncharacterized protein n=1 Tax=Candidatus Roizmanbacteria bacterium CG_4_9_14_0_2_um_filter_39_13 TaxID=1974839 RepID=A0A2M8EZA2_9BACT|nr:MAG: hypothetical protein CO051_03400 [Candidatus Roizmanbacteria bacterium CG_4_9_14_0_2_um_filter_39_13]